MNSFAGSAFLVPREDWRLVRTEVCQEFSTISVIPLQERLSRNIALSVSLLYNWPFYG